MFAILISLIVLLGFPVSVASAQVKIQYPVDSDDNTLLFEDGYGIKFSDTDDVTNPLNLGQLLLESAKSDVYEPIKSKVVFVPVQAIFNTNKNKPKKKIAELFDEIKFNLSLTTDKIHIESEVCIKHSFDETDYENLFDDGKAILGKANYTKENNKPEQDSNSLSDYYIAAILKCKFSQPFAFNGEIFKVSLTATATAEQLKALDKSTEFDKAIYNNNPKFNWSSIYEFSKFHLQSFLNNKNAEIVNKFNENDNIFSKLSTKLQNPLLALCNKNDDKKNITHHACTYLSNQSVAIGKSHKNSAQHDLSLLFEDSLLDICKELKKHIGVTDTGKEKECYLSIPKYHPHYHLTKTSMDLHVDGDIELEFELKDIKQVPKPAPAPAT